MHGLPLPRLSTSNPENPREGTDWCYPDPTTEISHTWFWRKLQISSAKHWAKSLGYKRQNDVVSALKVATPTTQNLYLQDAVSSVQKKSLTNEVGTRACVCLFCVTPSKESAVP